ncbi:hypothetical protein HETIRDRAFT_105982 [Heterobasidion irregulare TC 32-1]|uniref:Uncharacterized protein n=1 Tax=Heterobasidion irregulare (strain TC 32-1) TaxID=747525 RepID=W4JSI6_HETIT|nr:uncharacterized protein HETIRDRAFT_105982 [Heterobasidion irregulare TC 32-1]ETW76527.1 hypothetical protein HETIRDRAFT_105982 [Heterobasidion irregulare TC 32-1]
MAAQFEEELLNSLPAKHGPMLKRREKASEHFEVVSSKKRHTAAVSSRDGGRWDVIGSKIRYRDRETCQVMEASVIDARSSVVCKSEYPSVMPADGNADSCREFYRKCDAILALPSTDDEKYIIRFRVWPIRGGSPKRQDSRRFWEDLGDVVILKYLAAAAATQFMMDFEIRKATGNGGKRFEVVGKNIQYEDRRMSQVREASVLDAGSSVVQGDYYRIQNSEGQQNTIAMEEVISTE